MLCIYLSTYSDSRCIYIYIYIYIYIVYAYTIYKINILNLINI